MHPIHATPATGRPQPIGGPIFQFPWPDPNGGPVHQMPIGDPNGGPVGHAAGGMIEPGGAPSVGGYAEPCGGPKSLAGGLMEPGGGPVYRFPME